MLKKVFLTITTIIAFGHSLLADDYYNYGQYPMSGYSAGGFIDKNGKLGEPGKEYVFHINGSTGYIHRVDTEGDPQMHPDNPDSTGAVSKRTFTLISSHYIPNARPGGNSFYIDDTGIYYGPCGGTMRWDFDWSNETTVVSKSFCGQTFAGNPRTGDFWAGDSSRRLYKWDGSKWAYQFTYPNLGGGHHDGMTIANDTLFVSDMTSDYIATYKLDKEGNVINPAAPDHIYKYTASPVVENMGFGPNNHIWITAGNVVYEIGGGKLQEQLASCTQGLTISDRWEMLSSRCDIKHSTGFRDTVIMKMVGDHLVVITDDNDTKSYYENLGYETNSTLELVRGEGFWIRAEVNGTRHALNGVEESTVIHLKKDTTRFIGLPDWHKLDLDETFGDKPVKEIRYYDSNTSQWKKWQPNHVDTNLTEIVDGHGFYICVADDFDISLPNLAPVAKITGDLNVTIGQQAQLNGSKSFDRDGHIVSYLWKEGNVTLSTDRLVDINTSEVGWHKIVLTVTDDDGATGSIQAIVRVKRINTPPTVDLGSDINITESESRILSPSVNDSDGYILSYEWRVDGAVVAATPVYEIKELSIGEHNVSLSVLDNDLGEASDSILVTVHPAPDTTPPYITLLGDNPMIIALGSSFIDPGAIAIDDRDGNITVDSNGTVDTNATGEYWINYSAVDRSGNSAHAQRKVIVQDPAANTPPVVDLGSDVKIIEGEPAKLRAVASDLDGYIQSYSWQAFGALVVHEENATITDLTPGKYSVTVTVTDNKGAMASDSVIITVISKDAIDTTPPVITILGNNPHILNVGESYIDAGAIAVDDRDGNVSVGVEYNITTSKPGIYLVTYTASDRAGNRARAQRSVLVKDINSSSAPDTTPPVITLLGDNPFVVYKGEAFIDPGVVVVDDRDGQLGYSMRHNVNVDRMGSYQVIYEATDTAGNEANATRKVYVKDPHGNKTPVANAGEDHSIAQGSVLILDGSSSYDPDGDIVAYEWRDSNDHIVSDTKTATVDNLPFGPHVFTLSVKDNDGLSNSDNVTIRVIDPGDTTPPVAQIAAPLENTRVSIATEINGTASDEHLDYYTLSISPVGQDTYSQIYRGEQSVTDGVLGRLDVTTLANGIYDIKLDAVDENGVHSEAYTKIIVEGKAKIGNFSFTVKDMDLQVGGIPVQVYRTYSTLQRFKKRDLTYGWSLDYQNVKVEENIHPGKDWKTTPDVLVGYCFKDKKQHIVNIALPDGTTESFEFKFRDECRHYFPNHFYDGPVLKPLNGTTAKLEVIDASDTVMMNDYGELIDSQTLDHYDPNVYRLTLANGMVYEIDQNKGITRVKDIMGDYIQYTHDGIISSRLGKALSFERDSKDRIIKITDTLSGKSVSYHYDHNGDMDHVIDVGGAKTQYRYLAGHLMSEYFAPDGTRITKNIYDERGRLIKTIDPDGNVMEFVHDIDGREEIVRDRLGRTQVYVYDDQGNILAHTNAAGETTVHTYDAKGNELSVTDPLGHTTTNTYDAKGNLLSTTDALGHTETTTYNDKGSPTSITDKNGNTMSIVYNDYNGPRHIATALGATTTYYYDKFGNKIESINEYNQTTKMEYEKKWIFGLGYVSSTGNLLKETRPDGTVIEHTYDKSNNMLTTKTTYPDGTVTNTSNTYDAFNRLTSTTDERGNTTSYEYDARGNKVAMTDIYGLTTRYAYNNHNKLIKTTYPDGTVESKSYDAMDNLLSETDKEGYTTTYEYDAADRLVKTTYPDGSTTTNTYDAAGRLTSTTDQNGHTITYTYDAVGNKLSQTDALGNETKYTYDAQGNLLSVTDALNQTTTYEYNALNQRVKTIYPDGSTVVEAKNISGLPSSKTDEAGRTTNYSYDTARTVPLLSSVTLPNNAATTYTYDAQGKKTAQTDALGHTTQWRYEPTGELSEEILPDGSKQTHTYSPKGLEVQQTDYAGKSQAFVYNAYKQLVRIEYSDGSTVTYSYTPAGRIKTITDSQGTITNTYDTMGRLKTRTAPNGDTITYTYDAVGNITRIETPTQTITKTYDALNRLKTVTDNKGTTSYEYDAIGRQTQVTYPNGVTTSYEYDSRNRVTKIEHQKSDGAVLQSFVYTYDAVGNRLSETRNDGRRVAYEYNEVNQLTKATVTNDPNGNDTTTTYAYDEVGNLITKTVEGVEHTYTYDANDRLISKDGATLTYDANGNLIDDGTNTYEWDDKNRLVKVTTPTDVVEYLYDGEDNRIAKVTSGGTTTYLIDANTPYAQVITESKENGTEIHYTYGNDLVSDGTHYFLTDALGSTRGLTDNTESLTDSYDYHPYGELSSHSGTSDNAFLFTGEQIDQETNNYYLRARYYSPSLTRFLSRDPFEGLTAKPITLNDYIYAGNNPIRYTDPSGEFFGGMMFLTLNYGIFRPAFMSIRTGGTIQRGVALAIDAYFIRLGIQLRNEAIASIVFLIQHGGPQEAMDAAYSKYHYAVQIISGMSDITKMTQAAIGWAQAASSFANALSASGFPPMQAYKALSTKIGGGVEKIVKIQSRTILNSELDNLANLIVSAMKLLNKGRGLAGQ